MLSEPEQQGPWIYHVKELFRLPLSIAASGIPGYWLYRAADALAGRETLVNVNVAVALSISLAAAGISGLWGILTSRKNRKQSERLIQQRGTIEKLEAENTLLREQMTELRKERTLTIPTESESDAT